MSERPNAAAVADQFLTYLREAGLRDLLREVVQNLEKELQRSQDITVITAVPLSPADTASLAATLTERWGDHPVKVTVDPAIVSGVIARFQDQVLDASGRGQLNSLASHLSES